MYKALIIEEYAELLERYRNEKQRVDRRSLHLDIIGTRQELHEIIRDTGLAVYDGVLIDQHYLRDGEKRAKLSLSELAMMHASQMSDGYRPVLVVSKNPGIVQRAQTLGLYPYWLSGNGHHKQDELSKLVERLQVHFPPRNKHSHQSSSPTARKSA